MVMSILHILTVLGAFLLGACTDSVATEPRALTDHQAVSHDELPDLKTQDDVVGTDPVPPVEENEMIPREPVRLEIVDAITLLDALERADKGLENFSARVRYEKIKGLVGDAQVREGTLWFRVEPEANVRQFSVNFERLRIGNAVEEEIREFVFDGRWLVERIPGERQFLKREVVRPGEDFDPMSLEGPFPIPVGQKKFDILRRFNAELIPPSEDDPAHLRRGDASYHHLYLVPKQMGDDEDIEEAHFWYDAETLLPAEAIIVFTDGDETNVRLVRREKDVEMDDALFDTTTPATGWKVEVTLLKDAQPIDGP